MRHFAALATLVILATGCGSTPPARFYTLGAVPGPAAGPSELSVAVGPVTVPAAVERPQIVVSTGPNQVRLDEFNRWAAPLSNNIARVVAENLVAMLGTPRVTISPQTLSAGVDYRAVIEVQRFDSALGEAATMDAVWTVTRTRDGKALTSRTTVREATTASNFDALAAAHSRALARVSRGHRGRGTGARSVRTVGEETPRVPFLHRPRVASARTSGPATPVRRSRMPDEPRQEHDVHLSVPEQPRLQLDDGDGRRGDRVHETGSTRSRRSNRSSSTTSPAARTRRIIRRRSGSRRSETTCTCSTRAGTRCARRSSRTRRSSPSTGRS